MKQSALNKLLDQIEKDVARSHKWKFSRGFIIKKSDTLFFSLIIAGQAKSRYLHKLLQYKLLAFDDLFWKIVKLEENAKQPLSFRAAGAWTAPMTTISTANFEVEEWETSIVTAHVEKIILESDAVVDELTAEIQDTQANLRIIEKLDSERRQEYPNGGFDIWRERLLTALLQKNIASARNIIQDRQNNRDFGGFMAGNKTFYDLADEYINTII